MNAPEKARRLYESALQDYQKERPDEAVKNLTRMLETFPSFEDAYEALSVILYNQKRYDAAIPVLKKWITLNPHSIMAHTNLSRCYVAKGMILEAEREQAEARRLTWLVELKTKKQALPKKDYEEQIQRFKQVIELDPSDVLGYFSLGQIYLECGEKREAADTFEKAVEADPKHSSSYLGLGQALQALGDSAKARRIFQKGIEVASGQGDVMTQKKMEAYLARLGN